MRPLSLLLLALSLSAGAQTPHLVKDINTTVSTNTESSVPRNFTRYRDRVYFVATSQAAGTELWSANPGGGDAKLVADIIPGTAGSNPDNLRVINDVLLFTARDVNHGIELWTTDGTANGTHLFLDINPGPTSSDSSFGNVILDNRLFFDANDGVTGYELWSTDGTPAGTHLVKDLAAGSASAIPAYYALFRGQLYFSALAAIWKTDGTEAGTVQVAAVNARLLTPAGPSLYFQSNSGSGGNASTGWELWVTDGSSGGAHRVKEIRPGTPGAFDTWGVTACSVVGDHIVFAADDGVHGRELWVSDGTDAGTRLLHEFEPGEAGLWNNTYAAFTSFGGRSFFAGRDDEHGVELWVTDGTDAGTHIFADLVPGPEGSNVYVIQGAGARLFVAAASENLGDLKLWVTDGAQPPHTLGADRSLTISYEWPSLTNAGDRLYFSGNTPLTGSEPWTSDGTEEGTRTLGNLAVDTAPSSSPSYITRAGDLLYFWAAENGYRTQFWRSDGTAEGTFMVFDAQTYHHPPLVAGSLAFLNDPSYGSPLLISDGTVNGSRRADDFMSRFGPGADLDSLYETGDAVYARVSFQSPYAPGRLYRTTAQRTAPATDLGVTGAGELMDVAGRLFFWSDQALWTSDGTPAGTHRIYGEFANASYGSRIVNAGGMAYFLAASSSNEQPDLWKSDGTTDGTVKVASVPWDTLIWTNIVGAGRNVFFANATSLWKSDGTAAGTVQVAQLPEEHGDNGPMVAAGDRIVFTRRTGSAYDIWASDGTPDGTTKLATTVYRDDPLASIDGLMYFAAQDDAHGTEPWVSDGTVAGTKLLVDLEPGAASSSASNFTKLRDTLYFSAYTQSTGRELWALPLTDARVIVHDARATESAGQALHFNVDLSIAATHAVTVDYATADGTATAGEDYDASNGTLTFAPGETRKTIDVQLRTDAVAEGNETLSMNLRNADGATLANVVATGIIDDDDQSADVRIVNRPFTADGSLRHNLELGNAGPTTATQVALALTSTPKNSSFCYSCDVGSLSAGATQATQGLTTSNYRGQTYYSHVLSAYERDPNPANNAVHWTVDSTGNLVMDAAFLHPGETATIALSSYSEPGPVESSDPSVLSLSSLAYDATTHLATATVTALKPGTSTITVQQFTLLVTVVAAGTTPRFPGALETDREYGGTPRLDRPVVVTVQAAGTAPISGATATGLVTVSAGGHELARRTISGTNVIAIPVYFDSTGQNQYQISYEGDANFLPETFDETVYLDKGHVSLAANIARVAGRDDAHRLTVRVEGSPRVAPTGHVYVYYNEALIASLPVIDGVASGELANLPLSPTVSLEYSGDFNYESTSQEVRLIETHRRSSRH